MRQRGWRSRYRGREGHWRQVAAACGARARAQGLSSLAQLKILDVSSNLITKVQGLEGLTQLEDLWLNDNSAWGAAGSAAPVPFSRRRLSRVQRLTTMPMPLAPSLPGAGIADLDDELAQGLQPVAATLTTIYLEHNPAVRLSHLQRGAFSCVAAARSPRRRAEWCAAWRLA